MPRCFFSKNAPYCTN
uniref:Uncharacterized protein n=1 Tax=Anguilla anguilla TaxID=7936 RepID=A0A0E9PEZ7_ANGAN